MLASQRTITLRPATPSAQSNRGTAPLYDAPEVILILNFGNNQILELTGQEGARFTLGRSHATNPAQPEIDLTHYGGDEYGTSRLHAALFWQGGAWWLEDLNSSNGTWLNDERLAPFTPVFLASGSRVRLANLEIDVMICQQARRCARQ